MRSESTTGGPAAPRAPVEAVAEQEAGLRALFAGEYEAMVRLAFVLVNDRHDAEEIVQDAFVDLQARWSAVLNPGGYLRTAVVNGARRRGRRERRRSDILHRFERTIVGEAASIDVYDHTLDALEVLPERQHTALVLAYYVGLSSSEIAEVLGCRPGTAKSLVHRGLQRLRKEMDR
ncbi:MAG: sigma-70 family RNA polymerase sigma factor [Actinomycetota bacterium]